MTNLKVGDKFTVGNPDKPAWLEGEWIVVEVADKGYRVKKYD